MGLLSYYYSVGEETDLAEMEVLAETMVETVVDLEHQIFMVN